MELGLYLKQRRKLPDSNVICDIYCIKEPRTSKIMYIGCTSNFKKRILAHRHTPWRATKKELWVKSLKELNIQPHFEVIKSIKGRELALKEERRLITLINPPLNSIL